jgi:hypothetical protein
VKLLEEYGLTNSKFLKYKVSDCNRSMGSVISHSAPFANCSFATQVAAMADTEPWLAEDASFPPW